MSDTRESEDFDRALRHCPSNYSHLSFGEEVIVWYDTARDSKKELIEYIQDYTNLNYVDEKECHFDTVRGLKFL